MKRQEIRECFYPEVSIFSEGAIKKEFCDSSGKGRSKANDWRMKIYLFIYFKTLFY